MQHFLPALALAGVISVPALAEPPPVSSIRVTGNAKISAQPDRVQIDIGVSTRAPKSQDAASQNARAADAVLAAVKGAAGSSATLKTINYSLNPEYQYHPNGGEPTLTGYTAANTVQVTLDDLTRISAVLDAATHAGANQVQGIRFTLKDEEQVRMQALRAAAQRARAEAEVLASALNLRIDRVLQAEEAGGAVPVFQPAPRMMAAAAPAAATPVEAGTLDVNAAVTLTVEVSPAAR
jgi:uncharacterized protein